MQRWQSRTSKYFYNIVGAVVLVVVLFLIVDSYKTRQVRGSLTTYMDNLRDMIFMSTYDSLKKGNMKLFTSHLQEIGTFGDVQEFSLLDQKGTVQYSSEPNLLKQIDVQVLDLDRQKNLTRNGFTTYYFPVETISYCSRCHRDWKVGDINSYYKLTLSRKALDTVQTTTFYFRGFTIIGGGLFLGFIYLLLTLFERRKHEEQLHLTAGVFENAVEAIVITTVDGLVERVNPAFTRITGYGAEEIIGRDILLIDAGAINRESYQQMREQIRAAGFWSGEIWNKRKEGARYPVKLSVTAIRNRQGRVTHFVSILYDISIEKAAERSLVEMNQLKSEFISSAAHELRTPLNTMMGYVEFAKDPEKFGGFAPEQVAGFLSEAYDRGDALNQIINDFLDISRIENGYEIELNLQDVGLAEFMQKTVESYQVHNSSHRFRLQLCADPDSARCTIDRHRISQVLENLLSNAVKYSAEGSDVLLSLDRRENFWAISVVDHGIGMTPEQLERVFDKFYRADSANPAVSGLGLGMSIAKKIIEQHNGTIRFASVKNMGTTATILLPRSPD